MKEFMKKITIVFLIISFILSSVNISVFQVFASEISGLQETSNTVVESNENDLLELDESDNQEGESEESAKNKNGADVDTDGSKEESTDADEGTTGSSKNTVSSSKDETDSSKNTANLDEGKDGSDNNSTGSDKNPENSNGNSTTPNENLNNSKDDSEDSEETSKETSKNSKEPSTISEDEVDATEMNSQNPQAGNTFEEEEEKQEGISSYSENYETIDNNEVQLLALDNGEDNDFSWHYDDEDSVATSCGKEEINNVISNANKNIIIEVNRDVTLSSTLTFDKPGVEYIIDIRNHTLTIEEGYRFIDIEGNTNVTIRNGILKNGDNQTPKYSSPKPSTQEVVAAIAKIRGIIYCEKGTLTINELNIEGNKSGNHGAVYIKDGNFNATKSSIKNNTSKYSGGIYLEGNTTCKMEDCEISDNYEKNGNLMNASGIYVDGATLEATKLHVTSNTCDPKSICTGFFVETGKVTLTDSVISGNSESKEPSSALGAGLTVWGGDVTLKNTVIKNNTGHDSGGLGICPKNDNIIFNMNDGGIYNNTATNVYVVNGKNSDAFAHDIVIKANSKYDAKITIPAANKMTDKDSDIVFSDYCWGSYKSEDNYVSHILENNISITTLKEKDEKKYLYVALPQKNRVVAENITNTSTDNNKYTTIKKAIEEANSGDTIKLIAGDDGKTGNIVNEDVEITNKDVIIDLNGKKWNSGNAEKKALTIDNSAKVTIKGKGSITEIDYKSGELKLDTPASIDKIYLGKGKKIKAGNDFLTNTRESTITFVLYDGYLKELDNGDIVLIEGTKNVSEEVLKNIKIEGSNNSVIITTDNNNIVAHKLKAIYIDGTNGNNDKPGNSVGEAVKTFSKVKEMIEEDNNYEAVFVTNTITIENTENLCIEKDIPIYRYSDFDGYLINVKGDVTLKNITIDGQGDKVLADSAIIKVEDGGKLKIEAGTYLINNYNTEDSDNQYFEAGGAVYCDNGGTVIMNGGKISGNKSWYGAGIEIAGENSIMTMNDGEISDNEATKNTHGNGGGGIAVLKGATLNMNGGSVSNNKSIGNNGVGGGILIGETTYITTTKVENSKLNMNGGKINGNTAVLDGGGIYIQCNCTGTIKKGEIINNSCTGTEILTNSEGAYGGGGIYVNGSRYDFTQGELYISNAYIANNTSGGGSAIAGCGTSTVKIYPEGATIYNNNKEPEIYVDSTKDSGYATNAKIDISRYSTSGGLNHWYDIETKEELSYGELSNLEPEHILEIDNSNAEDLDTEGKLSPVKITGNTSARLGGGIGTNGFVQIGEPTTTNIKVTKKWQDGEGNEEKRPTSITVDLYANDAFKQTVELTKETGWTYTFEELEKYTKNDEKITYSIKEKEVSGYFPVVDGYNITNIIPTSITVTKKWNDGNNQYGQRPDSVTIHLLADGEIIETKSLTEEDKWTYTFTNIPKYDESGDEVEYTIKEDEVAGYKSVIKDNVITNTLLTSVSVTKTWNDGEDRYEKRPDSIKVQLLKNGEIIKSQDVTADTDWGYTFDELPKFDEAGNEIVYTIDEEDVDNYIKEIDGYNLINTYYIDINGTKTWDDKKNQDGKRPDSIIVYLLKNGKRVGQQEVTEATEWKYSFTDLPKYEGDEEIEYSIDEDEVDGYTKKVNGYNITNTHTPETIDIDVTKTWDDKDNQDGKRPEKITVHLYADGKEIKSEDILATEGNEWKYSFTGLPRYSEGHEIVYTIDESGVEGYTKKINGYNITNSYTPETININGRKTWNDKDNQDGKRPDKITVYVLANGEKVASKDITEADNWEYSFTNLPKYSKGHEIVYTVDESEVEDYNKKIDGYNLINSYDPETVDISGRKIWNDNENQDGKRPDKIIVNLLANGEKIDSKEVTEADKWEYSFTGLPRYKKGQKIQYTIDEDQVVEYTKEVNEYNLTNTHTPETVDISGIKTWNDNEDQDGKRPDSITVYLLADGEQKYSKEVTEADAWAYSFEGLPKYSEGQEIEYTVDEGEVENYTKEINGYNITNTHTPETVVIGGTKTWKDNDNQDGKRPEKIIINLLADGEKVDSKEVTEADGWKYLFTGLPKYSKGQEIKYTIDEDEVADYTKEEDGYDVTNTHTPETVDIGGTKTWKDNDNQDGKRPDKIIIHIYADGQEVDSKEVTEADEWSYLFTGLPKYSKGQEIKYTIDEEVIADYTKEINGYNITNTHIPETVAIGGTKTWNDNDNQDGKRPDSIIVYLLANGEIVDSKEVTEADEWKYLFTGLPKYSKGQEIMYTIDEEVVADYTKEIDGYNLINTHITKDIDEDKDKAEDEDKDINTKPEAPKEYPKTGDNILMNITVWLISTITGIVIIKKEIFN